MEAGYLIKLLQTVDPKTEVTFTVGRTPEERKHYAMAEILDGTVLESTVPHHAEIGLLQGDGVYIDIHLLQDAWRDSNIDNVEEEFFKKYKEIE